LIKLEFFNYFDNQSFEKYENQFGRLPSKLSDWDLYKEYISRFKLPFDFLIKKEVEEIVDKELLFQLLASSESYSILFEITDNDEIDVQYHLAFDYPKYRVSLSDIEASEVQSKCLEFLISHLSNEVKLANEFGSKEDIKKHKQEQINQFYDKVVPMLKLKRNGHNQFGAGV